MPEPSLLPVGRVRKAHGIKGEVSVDYYADSLELLDDGVFLEQPDGRFAPCAIISCRLHHGSLLLCFAGVQDRNAAELLRGKEIRVPEEKLPDDGGIYRHSLPGLRVIAVDQDGTETDWGCISSVMDPAGQELWTISSEGREDILFPAVPELVLGIFPENGVARIAPPPGLFELYRS